MGSESTGLFEIRKNLGILWSNNKFFHHLHFFTLGDCGFSS